MASDRTLRLVFVAALSAAFLPSTFAACGTSKEIDAQRIAEFRVRLFEKVPADFRVYADGRTTDGKSGLVLYSVENGDSGVPTIYLAVTDIGQREKLVSTLDLTSYIPHSLTRFPPVSVDLCLNTFMVEVNLPAVHLNLFAKSNRTRRAAATDVILVVREDRTPEPVLELWETSSLDAQGAHSASVIAILPSTTAASQVIWKLTSSQSVNPMMMAGFVQNTAYRWDGKAFRETGTLSTAELAENLKVATPLARSDQITPIKEERVPDLRLSVP